jgi:hypothetical protein
MAAGRRVVLVDPQRDTRTTLATFIRDGDRVRVTWDVPSYERDFFLPYNDPKQGWRALLPVDGALFWDVLPLAFATSSTLSLEAFDPASTTRRVLPRVDVPRRGVRPPVPPPPIVIVQGLQVLPPDAAGAETSIDGVVGADGGPVACRVGGSPKAPLVYVVHELGSGGRYARDVALLGFTGPRALDAFRAGWPDAARVAAISAWRPLEFQRGLHDAAAAHAARADGAWSEEEHPREHSGEFADKGEHDPTGGAIKIPRTADGKVDYKQLPGNGPWRIYACDNPDFSYRGRSTVMVSTRDGMAEFLGAPCPRPRDLTGYVADATKGWTNGDVIQAVMGSAGTQVKDKATFDAVSGRHGVKCQTFEDAFRACAVPYTSSGHRDWRHFDLKTLQDCHPAFKSLSLPTWVHEMQLEHEQAEHYARHEQVFHREVGADDEAGGHYYGFGTSSDTTSDVPF